MNNFSIIFLSIVLEAMPFIFLGTLISSTIEVLMPSDWLVNKLSHKKIRYYLIAGLIGIIMPVCECAIVPIMRRLVKKGIPVGIATTFMLATPILNPIVMLSTYYAFSGDLKFVVGRGLLGYIGAILIGLLTSYWTANQSVLKEEKVVAFELGTVEAPKHQEGKIKHIIAHMSGEFIDVCKYLILGAFIAATMQAFVPKAFLLSLASNPVLSVVVLMALAFVLSLCSEADAFIAATFRSHFSNSAIMAFLIFGPMIDIKNTMMLAGAFKKAFVIKLIIAISAICFFLGSLFALIG